MGIGVSGWTKQILGVGSFLPAMFYQLPLFVVAFHVLFVLHCVFCVIRMGLDGK